MSLKGPAKAGVEQMGLTQGMVVEELGWDDDVDEDFRQALMALIDADLVEEWPQGVDAVLLWVRSDDGDVVDLLTDALVDLSPRGVVWLLTPKIGRPGFIVQAELNEAAIAAGLVLTSSVNVSAAWSAHKLVRSKGGPIR